MDAHTAAMLGVAAFGIASALFLVAVVALRLRVDGGSLRIRSRAR